VDKHYTHIGDEAQEQAIHQLFGNDESATTDRGIIEKALKYIDSIPKSRKSKQLQKIESILKNNKD
jgi:hypothetical protein